MIKGRKLIRDLCKFCIVHIILLGLYILAGMFYCGTMIDTFTYIHFASGTSLP